MKTLNNGTFVLFFLWFLPFLSTRIYHDQASDALSLPRSEGGVSVNLCLIVTRRNIRTFPFAL